MAANGGSGSNLTVSELQKWKTDVTNAITQEISEKTLSSMADTITQLSNIVNSDSTAIDENDLNYRLKDLAEFVSTAQEVLTRGMNKWNERLQNGMDILEQRAREAAETARQARDQFKESADALEKIIPST